MKDSEHMRVMGLGAKVSRDIQDKQSAPSDEIWSIYNREADAYDRRLVEGWRDDMDGTLIFAGLFSATVTAFIIESYKNLKPDSSDITATILMHMSQQLASGNHTAAPAITPDQIKFQAPPSAVRCNVLLFLSLIFSLISALAAILTRQWARNYLHGIQRRRTAPVRSLIRSYLHEGIKSFRLSIIVNAIPTFLHIALFLFGGGIYEFFAPIHPIIRNVALFSMVLGAILYVGTAVLASLCSSSPYQTTLSAIFWYLVWPLYYLCSGLRGRFASQIEQLEHHADVPKHVPRSRPQTIARVTRALQWTLQTLDNHEKFEPFVAGLPEFFNSREVDTPQVVLNLLEEPDDDIMSRTQGLLHSVRSGEQSKRISIAIPAIWSLTYETCGIREGTFSTINFWDNAFRVVKRYVDADDPVLASQARHTVLVLLCRSREEDYACGWAQRIYTHAEIISTLEQIRLGSGRNSPPLELSSHTPDDLHMAAFTMLLSALRHGSSFPLPIAWNSWPNRQNIIPSLIRSLDMSRVCSSLQHHFVETVVDALVAQLKDAGESKVYVDDRLLRLLTTVTDYDSLVSAENLLGSALLHSDSHRYDRAVSLRKQYQPILVNIRGRLTKRQPNHNLRSLSLSSRRTDSESEWQSAERTSSLKKEGAVDFAGKEAMQTSFTDGIERRCTPTFSSSQDTLLDDGGGYYRLRVGSEESELMEAEFTPGKQPLLSKPVVYHRLSS